ncbi:helix-turn-helix domain-containing protein [Mycobacteroides saopaulense]|uniref:Transcriptional regulator n=1 Tax=Mycobacteroides saopaulense TaxID=1578165 RepID=A0ABX3BS87_9MYCO|nr:XRE family transcriptional regulator [Mycobacteroides saopaulense]ALR10856.1 transcriptional regulator [Mycobacteroides saopaulense]OHT82466.1 transcriptional regulator [Mycobacteroides saopaulense]OHU01849.1 transcriptional regulator [Mycobacteroides saopaulense]
MASLVRALRRERGLTLEELGGRTGLTKSYLSKVEREHSTPSVSVAMRIAAALDVDVSRLFTNDAHESRVVVDRGVDVGDDSRFHALSTEMLGKIMTPFLASPSTEFAEHKSSHEGQEFVFVHRGSIELQCEDVSYVLDEGDSAYLDATRTHRIRRTSRTPALVIIVAAT